ncbi:MAG: outer membrane protein assembly factor BamB family protein [Candidatus Cryosericum sp.]
MRWRGHIGNVIIATLTIGLLMSSWGCTGSPAGGDQQVVQVGDVASREGAGLWAVTGMTSLPSDIKEVLSWSGNNDVFDPMNSPYPYRSPVQDIAGTIFIPDSGLTALNSEGAQSWHATVGDGVEGPVVVAGAFVYVVAGETNPDNPGDQQDRLWCLDAGSGTVAWKTEPIGHSAGVASGTMPVIADGKVFLAVSELTEADMLKYGTWTLPQLRGKTYIGMWNATSGKLLGKNLAAPWDDLYAFSTTACTDGRTIFFAGPAARDNREEILVQAVDAGNGKSLWSRSVLPGMKGNGVLALAGDTVIFEAGATAVSSSTNGQQDSVEHMYAMAFSSTTGAVLWTQELPTGSLPSLQSPRLTVVGRTVYMPTRSGQIVAEDVDTGHRLWEKQLPGVTLRDRDESTQEVRDVQWHDSFWLAATPEVLYVVSKITGGVRALRLTDGATLWERDVKLVDGIWPVEKGLLVLCTPYDDVSGQKGQTRLELWH